MRFISAVDSATPPTVARTWPSSELPAPNGITGRPSREQTARAAATSAVVRGKITQSGRAGASTDSSRLWCSRVLWAALNREPNILSSSESAFSRDEAGGIASPSWPNVQPERHPQAYASSGVARAAHSVHRFVRLDPSLRGMGGATLALSRRVRDDSRLRSLH